MDNIVLGGLKKSKYDPRHFVLGAIFGVVDVSELPEEYLVGEPLEIKDQRKQPRNDMCAACASVSVSELQEGKILNVEYQFAKIKQIIGDWQGWGADLIRAAKSLIKFGSIEQEKFIKIRESIGNNELKEAIANWNLWPKEIDELAKEHKKQVFFVVRPYGGLDLFDAMRSAMWQFRNEKRGLVAGTKWSNKWTSKIFIDELSPASLGHAIAVLGWVNVKNKLYLVIQNSGGEEIGKKGIQYFSREVVNKRFTYDVVMFKDDDPEEIKKGYWSWWQRIWDFFIKLFK